MYISACTELPMNTVCDILLYFSISFSVHVAQTQSLFGACCLRMLVQLCHYLDTVHSDLKQHLIRAVSRPYSPALLYLFAVSFEKTCYIFVWENQWICKIMQSKLWITAHFNKTAVCCFPLKSNWYLSAQHKEVLFCAINWTCMLQWSKAHVFVCRCWDRVECLHVSSWWWYFWVCFGRSQ